MPKDTLLKMQILAIALAFVLVASAMPARADDVADPIGYPTLKTAGVAFGTINDQGFYARPGFSVEEPGKNGLLVPLLLTGLCGLIWLGGQSRRDRFG
jgi:hypothetical protein